MRLIFQITVLYLGMGNNMLSGIFILHYDMCYRKSWKSSCVE